MKEVTAALDSEGVQRWFAVDRYATHALNGKRVPLGNDC